MFAWIWGCTDVVFDVLVLIIAYAHSARPCCGVAGVVVGPVFSRCCSLMGVVVVVAVIVVATVVVVAV